MDTYGWKKNANGVKADKSPVLNVDLWKRLDKAIERHEIEWHWVKGHAGHDENERCDELARSGRAISPQKKILAI